MLRHLFCFLYLLLPTPAQATLDHQCYKAASFAKIFSNIKKSQKFTWFYSKILPCLFSEEILFYLHEQLNFQWILQNDALNGIKY
jgi:hypothetical protein